VPDSALLHTPLFALHQELGARLAPFAGYRMPVQYPAGLLAEHHHTRQAASLFDVSHMGQISVRGASFEDAARALESILPVDILGLGLHRQRYALLLNAAGGIMDDLMLVRREADIYLIVNGACKAADLAHIEQHLQGQCTVEAQFDRALLALQGPQAAAALAPLLPGVEQLVFMTGAHFTWQGVPLYVTRSGYTGEDGFEIAVAAQNAEALARALLAQPQVKPAGLGARNSLRLEAGLCLYGNDLDATTTPAEATLAWALQKVRRSGGARAGGFIGSGVVLPQLDAPDTLRRVRVALLAGERVPVRDGAPLHDENGQRVGHVTSGLLSPTLNQPVALGYVTPQNAAIGTLLHAQVRGKSVPMRVQAAPFVSTRYYRG